MERRAADDYFGDGCCFADFAQAAHWVRWSAIGGAGAVPRRRTGTASAANGTGGTAPITAHHFHEVCAGGAIGNLVLAPPVELAALPLALAGLAIGWELPIWIATELVHLVDLASAWLAELAPIGKLAVVGAPTLAALVALSLWLSARGRWSRREAAAWLALCLCWTWAREPPPLGALRVTFLDVGQGDAALIELPDGAVWLIDAGGAAGGRDLSAAAAPGTAISRALAAYGHHRISLAIITHPHPDHYLGLAAIDAPIDELWSAAGVAPPTPPNAHASPAALPSFHELAEALRRRGARRAHPPLGLARTQAGVELIVHAPRYQAAAGAPLVEAADPVRTTNDNSLVVELRYRGRAILFAGDVEHEGEHELVAAGVGRVDVVKVAHHGSPTSSSPALVAATRPALAVISCGRANRFGFPAAAVIDRWRAAGAAIARTDLDGAITVVVDREGGLAVDRFVARAP